MEILTDRRVRDSIKELSDVDQGRILKHLDLLTRYGFTLPNKYLKKLSSNLWELRPGNIRLLLGISRARNKIVIVHGFKKKAQRTPRKELETANLRIKEYGS